MQTIFKNTLHSQFFLVFFHKTIFCLLFDIIFSCFAVCLWMFQLFHDFFSFYSCLIFVKYFSFLFFVFLVKCTSFVILLSLLFLFIWLFFYSVSKICFFPIFIYFYGHFSSFHFFLLNSLFPNILFSPFSFSWKGWINIFRWIRV